MLTSDQVLPQGYPWRWRVVSRRIWSLCPGWNDLWLQLVPGKGIYLLICPSIYLNMSTFLSFYFNTINTMSIYLSICLSMYLFVYLYLNVSICRMYHKLFFSLSLETINNFTIDSSVGICGLNFIKNHIVVECHRYLMSFVICTLSSNIFFVWSSRFW